jgi:hypothetical protein
MHLSAFPQISALLPSELKNDASTTNFRHSLPEPSGIAQNTTVSHPIPKCLSLIFLTVCASNDPEAAFVITTKSFPRDCILSN